jgi:S-adenosylmethionine hydrolase
MTMITLTTDFGLRDGNVGVMKGVIWRITPEIKIVDLSHDVPPQNILEGAYILKRSTPYFPAGTIHVGVVDPGVGTSRRPIAVQIGAQFFVGPDNGLITFMIERAESESQPIVVVHLDKHEYWLPVVSHVFHGRDIFAPVAAHLARGIPLEEMGSITHDIVRLPIPIPERLPNGWRGQVVYIDHFGNVATNLSREKLGVAPIRSVKLVGREIIGLVRTFGEGQPGELAALFSSTDDLIVAVVNGDASRILGVKIGDVVDIIF